MTQTAEQVETHFDRKSKEFDAFYSEKKGYIPRIIDHIFRRSMRLRYEKVIAGAAPYQGKTVLDVGCGAGRYCIALALKGVDHASGIDFADSMIEAAGELARKLGVRQTCKFIKAGFMETEFDQPFDHVFAMGVLDYIDQPAAFVKKMKDAAAKSVMISFPVKGGFIQWCRKKQFNIIKKCPVFFYSREDIEQIARQAGAEKFTIDKLAKDYFLTIYIA
jgi:2-polyprenyl-3-methyl-5-hydroxy-6-metoxy-1,4-benzoquinol methylase